MGPGHHAVVLAVALALRTAFCDEAADSSDSSLAPNNYHATAYTLTIRREQKTPDDAVATRFKCQVDIEIAVEKYEGAITLYYGTGVMFSSSDVALFDQHGEISINPEFYYGPINEIRLVRRVTIFTSLKINETYWMKISYEFSKSTDTQYFGLFEAVQPAETGTAPLTGTILWPTYAKLMMPCFEDPYARATYQLILETDHDETAVTNTNVIRTEPCLAESAEPTSCVQHTFEKTPAMTSSQFGFVVSQFGHQVAPVGSRGGYLGLYVSRRQLLDKSRQQRALCLAVQLYDACANLTGVEPYWNIILVAVRDLPFDSVDALGLILIRESALVLLNESSSTAESRVRRILAMAQNMARMWFGHVNANVEGAEKEVWTKESFATYLQYELAYQVTKDPLFRDLLYTRSIMPALHADSLQGTHFLDTKTVSDNDADFYYRDAITTGKGSAFLQTVRYVLTDAIFQQMVRNYFKNSSLEAALQHTVGTHSAMLPLCDGDPMCYMRSWTAKSGYPLVTATRDYSLEEVAFTQKRFLLRRKLTGLDQTSVWKVPLLYSHGSVPETPRVLQWLNETHRTSVPLPVAQNASKRWLLVNPRRTGFYRVNYEESNWKLLAQQTLDDPDALDPVSRAMLIEDALVLARAHQLNYGVALTVADSLRVEKDLIPWEAARESLGFLRRIVVGDGNATIVLNDWVRGLLKHVLEVVQFSPTGTDRQKLLRGVVMEMACELEMPACTVPALVDYRKWLEDPNSVPHDTLAAVVCAGLREDVAFIGKVTKALLNENDDVTRRAIIRGLGCVADFDVVASKLFPLTTTANVLRSGETALLFESISRSWATSQKQFIEYAASTLYIILRNSASEAISIYFMLCDRFSDKASYLTLEDVGNDLGRIYKYKAIQEALQVAHDNIDWLDRSKTSLIDALSKL